MQRKIISAILFTVIVISVSLGVISYIAVRDGIDHALQHKLQLAAIVAKNIDLLVSSSLQRLYDVSLAGTIDLADRDWSPEAAALKKAYDYSIFSDGIFIADLSGEVIYTYPRQQPSHKNLSHLPRFAGVIQQGRPYISDIITVTPSNKKTIYIVVPLKNKRGLIEGVVGGEIDPSALSFNEIIRSFPVESKAYMEIVDSAGIVIASTDAKRMFKDQSEGHLEFLAKLITGKTPVITKCHRCHTEAFSGADKPERSNDVMAYAPLETANWGVSIIQPEKDILAPIARMKSSFLMVSLIAIAIALIIAVGMSRSIVRPVHELIDATVKIAEGDMTRAVAFGGTDEIGMLSSSFEVMRVKLADSLEELQKYNAELERKVADRTRQISNNRRQIKDLLKKVITSQEEERKRIAREFHDVIMQDLAAGLIQIDLCSQYPQNITADKINEVRQILQKNIDDVYRIIKNLRPTILDDLGFEAAVRWLLDHHLESRGVQCYVTIYNSLSKVSLEPQLELGLFRIIQEAIINIAKHAHAENVFVLIETRHSNLIIELEDDGEGFDASAAFAHDDSDPTRGLGLLGMQERASFLNWSLKICSAPGEGTRVSLKVPLESEVFEHV